MSVLDALDDDFADILGSDHEDTNKTSTSALLPPHDQQDGEDMTSPSMTSKHRKHGDKRHKQKSPKKSPSSKRHKHRSSRHGKKSMLHSQSIHSLASQSSQATLSQADALALLQSESQKDLHGNAPTTTTNNNNKAAAQHPRLKKDDDDSSDEFDLVDAPSPERAANKPDASNDDDDESNDSILDWLDEPRAKTKTTHNKRPMLLQVRKQVSAAEATAANIKIVPPTPQTQTQPRPQTEALKTTVSEADKTASAEDIEQWKEWLGLNSADSKDAPFIYLAENAAKTPLPAEWEKVNENLYRNMRTNERTMTHPLLSTLRAQLQTLRRQQAEAEAEKDKAKETEQETKNGKAKDDGRLAVEADEPEANAEAVANEKSVDSHRHTVPARQIDSNVLRTKSKLTTVSIDSVEQSRDNEADTSETRPSADCTVTHVILTADTTDTAVDVEVEPSPHDSLMVRNLNMQLTETRQSLQHLMQDKTRLLQELEASTQSTELMLNEQRMRLTTAHRMEMAQLQKDNEELRALNLRLVNEQQVELLGGEERHRKETLTQKQHALNEQTLVEQRSRNEIQHQMELHRQGTDELKKQHQHELEMLNAMHRKQLENLRQHGHNEGQLNALISKMELSTVSLSKLQHDFEYNRDVQHKEREQNIQVKEAMLNDKDDDLGRERKAYHELLQKFHALAEETKNEKIEIRETQQRLKEREQEIVQQWTEHRREQSLQRQTMDDEREKTELQKSRWESQKQCELDDVQRLKNEHNKQIQIFFEEQEIERCKINKQWQLLNDDKASFVKMKKQFEIEHENLDATKSAMEQQRHQLAMECANFERRVEDISTLSRRVYQQSEAVTKMQSDAKQMAEENHVRQLQLTSEAKQLKMLKQQLLMEQQHMENERKGLEQEQLTLLTIKHDMLQQMDTYKALEKQSLLKKQFESIDTLYGDGDAHGDVGIDGDAAVVPSEQNCNLQRINLELQQLRDFVSECKLNIANYKQDVDNIRKQRESLSGGSLYGIGHSNSRVNRLSLAFPSLIPRTGSFGLAPKESMDSLTHSLSLSSCAKISRPKSANYAYERRTPATTTLSVPVTQKIRFYQTEKDQDEAVSDTENDEVEVKPTPTQAPGQDRSNLMDHTDTTLDNTSFVSMQNIDTPITIDNKQKYMKRIKENPRLQGRDAIYDEEDDELDTSVMPMTPTQMVPMSNLSKIVVTEYDNEQPIFESTRENDDDDTSDDDFDDSLYDDVKTSANTK